MSAANIKPRRPQSGFTLVEILVVIGIIVILISIAVPVVSKVRKSAQVAAVQSQMNSLVGVITQYQQDHGALPGPLSYAEVASPTNLAYITPNTSATGFDTATLNTQQITMAENLVLGLAGGLRLNPTGTGSPPPMLYDPLMVGQGPGSLNPASPKKYRNYIEGNTNLSWREANGLKTGQFTDGAGAANDTIIPEIVDTFPTRMPILYLRARKGQQNANPISTAKNDNLIYTTGTAVADRVGQYDRSQIVGYVGTETAPVMIGEGKTIDKNAYTTTPVGAHGLRDTTPGPAATAATLEKGTANYVYPYDGFAYVKNPSSPAANPQPREKDNFILISAGLDRVYGTADDITSFGPVNP